MKHIMAAVVMVLMLGLADLSAASPSPATARDSEAKAVSASREVTFSIAKMTCALCPVTVRKAMEKVAGVKDVKVDFATRTATVIFDPARTTIAEIALASANAGYPARLSGEE